MATLLISSAVTQQLRLETLEIRPYIGVKSVKHRNHSQTDRQNRQQSKLQAVLWRPGIYQVAPVTQTTAAALPVVVIDLQRRYTLYTGNYAASRQDWDKYGESRGL